MPVTVTVATVPDQDERLEEFRQYVNKEREGVGQPTFDTVEDMARLALEDKFKEIYQTADNLRDQKFSRLFDAASEGDKRRVMDILEPRR